MQPIIKGRRADEELCKNMQKINMKEFSLDCSQCHIQPRLIYLGIMVLSTVSWIFLHQLSILEIGPIFIPTDQYEETIIQLRFHLLEVNWVSSLQKTKQQQKKTNLHNALNIWTFEDPTKPQKTFQSYPPNNTDRRWGACSFVCLPTSSRKPLHHHVAIALSASLKWHHEVKHDSHKPYLCTDGNG